MRDKRLAIKIDTTYAAHVKYPIEDDAGVGGSTNSGDKLLMYVAVCVSINQLQVNLTPSSSAAIVAQSRRRKVIIPFTVTANAAAIRDELYTHTYV